MKFPRLLSIALFFRRQLRVLAFGFTLAALPAAFAEDGVAVVLTARKVVVADGKELLEAAEKAKPGDVIEYSAIYRNATGAAVKNLQATVPIPAGLALILGSAKPDAAQASTDGKTFRSFPLSREVKKDDGATEKQPVPDHEYRALRWSISKLPAGATTTVQLRARVLTNVSIQ